MKQTPLPNRVAATRLTTKMMPGSTRSFSVLTVCEDALLPSFLPQTYSTLSTQLFCAGHMQHTISIDRFHNNVQRSFVASLSALVLRNRQSPSWLISPNHKNCQVLTNSNIAIPTQTWLNVLSPVR